MQAIPPTPDDRGGWWSRVWRRVLPGAADGAAVRGWQEERQALKAAMARKRRNDRVRHEELNELRALMRAQQAAKAAQGVASGESSSHPSSDGGRSGWARPRRDQSRTIEQIARIEAQMAQHWSSRATPTPAVRISAPQPAHPAPVVPGHLQARGMSIDLVGAEPVAPRDEGDAPLAHPALTQAAVLFANGRIDEARQALETLQAQEVRSPLAREAGVLLLDLLWASGDVEGFEDWAAEWADRFRLPIPHWPATLPTAAPAPAPVTETPAPPSAVAVWVCPSLLDADAVAALAAALDRDGAQGWIDWSALTSADTEAAQRLTALFERWAERPLEQHWCGSAVLRRRLKASTPSGRRENPALWWRLRLATLRLLGRRDEFDLVALDYCVTYGELPPAWCDPVARVLPAERLPDEVTVSAPAGAEPLAWPTIVAAATSASETEFPAMPTQQMAWEVSTQLDAATARVCLEGVLQGDAVAALAALDQAAAAALPASADSGSTQGAAVPPVLRVDLRRLQRIDFAAAGALLQWLLAARARGLRVELDGVPHLIAALFQVVGITDAATVRLRQY
ncbi:STAS domain-containing protein [Tepidimonas taiwanensis]|uniref:STAS domain-containing protein n=1 Tax=Tepidimonas taiwanensis TaxID=307486 RepID=UPI000A72B231|nr:STAS domain-containing protein [Tepidimonas taiwanensis]